MPPGMTDDMLEDYKELFLLQDNDEDGILTLLQTITAIVMLGIRIGGTLTYCIPLKGS